MHDVSAPPRFLGMTAARAALLVIGLATLFRFFYATWLPMLPDETYYFQWSRHLDASYFSKGPAVAYTIWLGTHLFGPTPLGVRFFAVLLSAGTAWQIFLLARRWYDDTAALLAVLIAGVVPLYAIGAVLMTIDPLSAFFWLWAANFFSRALRDDRLSQWMMAGFAVGSGFLAKYLNALELAAFLAFLVLVPARRALLGRRGFWSMILTAVACALPVLWWNQHHHWASAVQLGDRGHVHDGWHISLPTILDFFTSQALVISPLLFLALLVNAARTKWGIWRGQIQPSREGDVFLFVLFLSVFLFLRRDLAAHPVRTELAGRLLSFADRTASRPLAGDYRFPLRMNQRGGGFLPRLGGNGAAPRYALPAALAAQRSYEPHRRLVADRRPDAGAAGADASRRSARRRLQGGQRRRLLFAGSAFCLCAAAPATGEPVRSLAQF